MDDPTALPAGQPLPADDGAAAHLTGLVVPRIALLTTEGKLSVQSNRLVTRNEGVFQMNQAEIRALMNDRVAQELIQAPIHARLAYTAKDGSPRVVPIGFIWTGDVFVMGSPPIAPKVKALSANPKVALTIDTEDFPPNILLVRGEAALETVEGVPDEFIEAARRFVGDERMPEWEAGARGLYKQMVLIRITPTWAKIIDFETRLPRYVEELTKAQ
jgi:Pyridoxamine 5'-phosphate oxidase